jgi:hypothetical protein
VAGTKRPPDWDERRTTHCHSRGCADPKKRGALRLVVRWTAPARARPPAQGGILGSTDAPRHPATTTSGNHAGLQQEVDSRRRYRHDPSSPSKHFHRGEDGVEIRRLAALFSRH